MTVEEKLDRLMAIEDIRRLKHRYARLCDAGYPPELATLFTEDARWESNLSGSFEGRDNIAKLFSQASSKYPWAVHIVVNDEVEVDEGGDRARARWILLQLATVPALTVEAGSDVEAVIGVARYDDTIVRDSRGRWRFHTMALRVERLSTLDQGWARQILRGVG